MKTPCSQGKYVYFFLELLTNWGHCHSCQETRYISRAGCASSKFFFFFFLFSKYFYWAFQHMFSYNIENWVWTRTLASSCCMLQVFKITSVSRLCVFFKQCRVSRYRIFFNKKNSRYQPFASSRIASVKLHCVVFASVIFAAVILAAVSFAPVLL